jgi:ribonuclease PH
MMLQQQLKSCLLGKRWAICHFVLCCACGAVEDTLLDLEQVYDAAVAAEELPVR